MTDFLYARPSLLEGIGRNLDFFGSMNSYNFSNTGEEADRIAIASDLLAVYKDFNEAYLKTLCQITAKEAAV